MKQNSPTATHEGGKQQETNQLDGMMMTLWVQKMIELMGIKDSEQGGGGDTLSSIRSDDDRLRGRQNKKNLLEKKKQDQKALKQSIPSHPHTQNG